MSADRFNTFTVEAYFSTFLPLHHSQGGGIVCLLKWLGYDEKIDMFTRYVVVGS